MGVWLGVPYATAARWAPPEVVPFDPAGGPHDRFGPSAPQRHDDPLVDAVPGMAVGDLDEHRCLTLNVWAPDGAEGLPVMVWIHGGAYVIGGSSLRTYDGRRLSEEGVVVVSFNYRLGALGTLCRPGEPANFAARDQIAALTWVRDHIAGFGGDPANVTVFGESAGAGALLHLLGMPAADGLYRRAILQSPGAEVVRRPLAEELAAAFDRTFDGDDVLAAQYAAQAELASRFGAMPWAPVVDGDLLPASPQERIAAGGLPADVDVLLGTTSTELSLFTSQLAGMPVEVVAKVARHLLAPILGRDPGEDACRRLVDRYDGDATAVLSDAAMGVPALRLTDDLSRRGRTFAYRFDWHAPVLGAFHACDLPFTFGTFDADGWGEFVGADDDARALSARMRRAWAGFARTGDPGWDEYDPERRSTIVLGRDDHVAEHPVAARRHHFEQEGLT